MRRTICTAAALLLTAMRISAHHAFAAEYDENKVVKVSGKVTRFEWINPHALLYVEGTDDNGTLATWKFEMGSPSGLLNRGWKKEEVKKGDTITLDGYCAKDGSKTANARNVILPDGRKLFGGFQSTPRAPTK